MATGTLIPLSEYLGHSFRPDRDYVDGELQERNLGELDHSDLQRQLLRLLDAPENRIHFHANQELRLQVKATRFRVPDVMVRRLSSPREQIIRTPPLLCIEVLSPEDTVNRMRARIQEYLDMGVPGVWTIDPATRTVTVFTGSTAIEHKDGTLSVPQTSIAIALGDIFSVLDEYRSTTA